jgi:hypothetical protein
MLLSTAPNPENWVPGKFDCHLTQRVLNVQRTQNVFVKVTQRLPDARRQRVGSPGARLDWLKHLPGTRKSEAVSEETKDFLPPQRSGWCGVLSLEPCWPSTSTQQTVPIE